MNLDERIKALVESQWGALRDAAGALAPFARCVLGRERFSDDDTCGQFFDLRAIRRADRALASVNRALDATGAPGDAGEESDRG